MGTILVGTSGYRYNEWVGSVYPAGCAREGLLARYASMFPTVELNETFYRMPTAERLGALLAGSGPDLSFSVKANEALTHRIDPSGWRDAARLFAGALEPLMAAGRLQAVLLQFPVAFGYDVDHRRYLNALLGAMPDLPLAVEFSNAGWYNNRVFDSLRARSVAVASLDLPELTGLPPVIDVITAPLAYIRLHGRNARDWWGSDAASRYDYLYSDEELAAWSARIRGMATRAETVLVYFNNHRRGQSVGNALTLTAILGRPRAMPEGAA